MNVSTRFFVDGEQVSQEQGMFNINIGEQVILKQVTYFVKNKRHTFGDGRFVTRLFLERDYNE